jgi:hypothetical protein
MTVNREELINLLKKTEVIVAFTKADGTERELHCTLQSHLLPVREVVEGEVKKERKVNESVIAAFDLQKMEWRSFRIDSVKYYHKL